MDTNEFKQRLAQSGMTRLQAAESLGISLSLVQSIIAGRRACTNEMACLVQKWPVDGSLRDDLVQEVVQTTGVVQTDGKPLYKSSHGKEWDVMPDGYARGSHNSPPIVRMEALTAHAYFRVVGQETGVNVFSTRVTKKEFDRVDWKKLGFPTKVVERVRSRLRPD